MIKIKNLCVEVGKIKILNDLNLEITKGEFVLVLGPSGCGKTTMLNVIAGLLKPSSGFIEVDGINLNDMTEHELDNYHNTKVSMVFQQFLLDDNYTVFENVLLPLSIRKTKDNKIKALAAINTVNLSSKSKLKTKVLSGGEKQRVSIARCIAMNTDIILADEATGSLDSANSLNIMNLLVDLNKTGKTIIFVTHNPEYKKYSNHIVSLFDGRIINETF